MDTIVLERPKARQKNDEKMKQTQTLNDKVAVQPNRANKHADAKERIKPRGLAGLFEGRCRYDEQEDIFNLKR